MNNADQIYNQAVDNVWEALRTAMFNYLYHEDVAAHYHSVAFWMRIATPALIVLGVVAAMWQPPAAEKARSAVQGSLGTISLRFFWPLLELSRRP